MQYQLVLQFRGEALANFDRIVSLENELIALLGKLADVDGHDIGTNEANVFLLTDDPQAAFAAIEPVLAQSRLLNETVAAFRPLKGATYTVVWPVGSNHVFRIT